jgi:4-amino-4-deoxychorismate lyase
MRRLGDGCARFGMPTPDMPRLADDVERVPDGSGDAVVRITLTRGDGHRGYALPGKQQWRASLPRTRYR